MIHFFNSSDQLFSFSLIEIILLDLIEFLQTADDNFKLLAQDGRILFVLATFFLHECRLTLIQRRCDFNNFLFRDASKDFHLFLLINVQFLHQREL